MTEQKARKYIRETLHITRPPTKRELEQIMRYKEVTFTAQETREMRQSGHKYLWGQAIVRKPKR